MKMNTRSAIFASVFIHVLFVAIFLLMRAPETQPAASVVSMEIVSRPEKSASRGAKSGSRRESGRDKKLSIRDLTPTLSFSASQGHSSGAEPDVEDSGWGGGGGNFKHIESASELQKLAIELDGATSYPSVLSKRDVSGTISARLYFQEEGGCDWKKTKVFPGHPYLRVYVLGVLKKVCGLGQIQTMKLRTSSHADLSFQFLLVDPQDQTPEAPPWITGNVIALERKFTRFPVKIDLGPITLLGGDLAHINFDWLFDKWDRLMGKKDPLAAFQE